MTEAHALLRLDAIAGRQRYPSLSSTKPGRGSKKQRPVPRLGKLESQQPCVRVPAMTGGTCFTTLLQAAEDIRVRVQHPCGFGEAAPHAPRANRSGVMFAPRRHVKLAAQQ